MPSATKEWDELYSFVKNEIFEYDKSQPLSRYTIDKLHELSGNCYSYRCILLTFIECKDFLIAKIHSGNWNGEVHMINYIIKVVESKLNDTYNKMKADERQIKTNAKLLTEPFVNISSRYKPPKAEKIPDKFKEMW